jgi:peptidoglycan/LPS O-acetylase OafA/YrhL
MPAAPLASHMPALDGLRGLAILLVIVHMLGALDVTTGLYGRALSYVMTVGWIGVQLFFVLSGFLITGILLDTARATNYLSGFFARRVLRIFPLYYVTLVAAFVILPLAGIVPPALEHDRHHQIWLWIYLSNWVKPFAAASAMFPHFWSLAVEEQFYLVWPFFIRAVSPRRCIQVCGVVMVGAIVARDFWWEPHGDIFGATYAFTVCRMDALAAGAAAAAALRIPSLRARIVAHRGALAAASLGVLVAGALVTHKYSLEQRFEVCAGYTFLAIGFALIVLAAAAADTTGARGWASLLRAAPLRSIGKYSYGMYVFHKLLHDYLGRILLEKLSLDRVHSPRDATLYLALGLTLTFGLAVLSYQLFERRFLRMKDRFEPRWPTAGAPPAPAAAASPRQEAAP